jgi:hypothetical protein
MKGVREGERCVLQSIADRHEGGDSWGRSFLVVGGVLGTMGVVLLSLRSVSKLDEMKVI